MSKKSEILKDGGLVTIGSLIVMAAAFALYYLIFMLFESLIINQDPSYGFVGPVRVGYGILWIISCLIVYRTKIPEWIKASLLAGGLTTFLSAFGVQLHQTPIWIALTFLLMAGLAVFLLIKAKKHWFHFYAVALAVLAGVFYSWPWPVR